MQIDVVSYTPTQLASLSFSGIREIRATQLKKNKLLRQLERNLQKEKNSLLKRGLFDSCIWQQIQTKMRSDCDEEIEELRQALLFYLKYATSKKVETDDVPYLVDYSLSFEERYVQVKNYYITTYPAPPTRFTNFINDLFAPLYLGEMYGMLYDEFALMAEA